MRLAAILADLFFATSVGADSLEDTRVKAEQGEAWSQYNLQDAIGFVAFLALASPAGLLGKLSDRLDDRRRQKEGR